MTATISVSELVKDFAATRALDHLDLTVRTEKVHGFFRPNGAGKTTKLRVLLGLVRKDAGAATVLGSGGMVTAAGLDVPDACLGGDGAVGRRRSR